MLQPNSRHILSFLLIYIFNRMWYIYKREEGGIMNDRLINEVTKGNVMAFYKSTEWNKKRLEILRRDHFECQKCKHIKHQLSRATVVHHKVHLRDDPFLMLDDDNLISLCDTCHNEEHPEKRIKNKRKHFRNEERW